MTLMSCFGLTRIYRLIFTRLESALMRSKSSGVPLDSLIPSIDLDGFGLERHFELQIKVLFEVAADMLDRVERSMEKVASVGCGNGDDSLLPLLFEIVLKQGASPEGESDDRATTMTSKKQVANISRLLQAKR